MLRIIFYSPGIVLTHLKIVFTLVVSLLITQSVYGHLCSDIFKKELILPRELRFEGELLALAKSGSHKNQVQLTAELFQSLALDNVLSQIAYSFRITNWTQNPGVEYGEFLAEVRNTLEIDSLTDKQGMTAFNIFTAINGNVDSGYLPQDQRILLSYLLSSLIRPSSFSRLEANKQYQLKTIQNSFDAERYIRFFDHPKYRKALENLMKDIGFKLTLENKLENITRRDPESMKATLKGLIKILGSKQFRLKTDRQGKFIASSVILLITNWAIISQLHKHPDILTRTYGEFREITLNGLEEYFLVRLQDPKLITPVVDIIDSAEFGTPMAINEATMLSSLYDHAKRFLATAKQEAKAMRGPEQRVRRTSTVFDPIDAQAQAADLFVPQPTSAKRQSKTTSRAKTSNPDSQVTLDHNHLRLARVEAPIVGTKYVFKMLRQLNGNYQSIEFTQEAVEPFEAASDISFLPFINAIRYGFTARDGSNGIKKIGTNMNLSENYYEVKPGSSRLRIILKRQGTHWIAIRTLHKDDIPRFLQSL